VPLTAPHATSTTGTCAISVDAVARGRIRTTRDVPER
jgi:hypothetical protein